MKKKVIAAILSLTMVLNTFSVAGAAELEFTDGEVAEAVEFEEAEFDKQIPEEVALFDDGDVVVEDDEVPVASVKPSETAIQIGNDVWVEFDEANSTAMISGSGDTWDYFEDGTAQPDISLKNPFRSKALNSIHIEDGVTRIGDYLFCGALDYGDVFFSVNEINIPETVTSIGDFAFYYTKNLKSIIIPSSVKTIGNCCFTGSSLNNVSLSEGLEYIGNCAFESTNISDIILPLTIKDMGNAVFNNCRSLNEVENFPKMKIIKDEMFNMCPITEFDFSGVTEIGEGAFCGTKVTEVNFTDGLTKIGNRAFSGCDNIKSLQLPDTVIEVGYNAFSGCSYINEIKLSANLKVLSNHLFWNCGNLKEIELPENVNEIQGSAFGECKRLEKIKIPAEAVFEWKKEYSDPFAGCSGLKEIVGYTGSCAEKYANEKGIKFTSIGNVETRIQVGDRVWATLNEDTLTLSGTGSTWDAAVNIDAEIKKNTKKIIIEEGITKLGDSTLAGFTESETITFPESMQVIDYFACYECKSIKEVILPKNLIKLEPCAFEGCTSLEKIVFPSSLKNVTMLTESRRLPNLKIVVIPEGVEVIAESAFMGCSGLKEIELPTTIKSIESGAFEDTGISDFIWPENITIIPHGVFRGCNALTEFTVPETVTEIGVQAFKDCVNLEKISVPKNVKYFGDDIFYNCRNLTIYGYKDSAAERYANNNDIPFISADYKVVFKNNGRTVKTEYIIKGKDATPPELTPREGYTLSWDADYTDIQEDMIINAVWTKNDDGSSEPPIIIYPPEETKYTVTFKDRGKTIKTEKVKSGEAADLPYLYRYGYELTWDKDFSNVTSNMTVNAIWTIIEPEKITNLTAEIISKKVSLSWDESEYAGYYKIYRKAAQDEKFTLVARTSQTLWNDRRAKTGIEYEYKAVAVRSVGGELYTSPESDVVTVKLGAPEVGRIYTVGNLNYKVMTASEVRVTGAAKVSGSVYIPNTVTISDKVFKVTSIDHKAFYKNENIVNVRIGNYVTYVGQYSFYRCPNLESVRFGKNVEIISTCAFTECPKLGNVVLPEKVKRLGAKVFYHCPNLKTLYIKTNDLEYIGKKGLAIDRKTIIKVPSRKYSAYKKMIEDSVKFSATKIVKL